MRNISLDKFVRSSLIISTEFFKTLFWSRSLFVCRVKEFLSYSLLYSLSSDHLRDYYKALYENIKNEHIKRKRYGNFVFYMRRGDDNMIKEVFFNKDYFHLDEFYPREGDVVLDLGAGIGDYAAISSRFVGDAGLVISVEADKDTYSLLKRNIEENGLTNVIAVNLTVSDKRGSRVDDIFRKYKIRKVDLIKMDIEGYEYLALLGARNILKRFHPKIVLEIHSTELRNKIKNYLERFGYKLVGESKKFALDFNLSYLDFYLSYFI